jgi:hypothetical protein
MGIEPAISNQLTSLSMSSNNPPKSRKVIHHKEYFELLLKPIQA